MRMQDRLRSSDAATLVVGAVGGIIASSARCPGTGVVASCASDEGAAYAGGSGEGHGAEGRRRASKPTSGVARAPEADVLHAHVIALGDAEGKSHDREEVVTERGCGAGEDACRRMHGRGLEKRLGYHRPKARKRMTCLLCSASRKDRASGVKQK